MEITTGVFIPEIPDPGAAGGSGWDTKLNAALTMHGARTECGQVFVDDFPGANDAAKLTAAMTYALAQTRVPWIVLPPRVFSTGSTSFTMATGLKIRGPGFWDAPMNEEISSGKGVVGKWSTSCGFGASALWSNAGTVYDVCFSNITFHGGSTSQIFRSTGNMYACEFNNLTFYGCRAAFGDYATGQKFLMTQVEFNGHWNHQGVAGTQYFLGGSDNKLWLGGQINIDVSGTPPSAGAPTIVFDTMSKTNVGYIYMTCRTTWGGVVVSGNSDATMQFYGGSYEGVSQASPAVYCPLTIAGGTSAFFGPWVGQTYHASNIQGVVQQTGGIVHFYSPVYQRGTSAPASFPWLYQTGGVARIYSPVALASGEQMRIRWSSGTTDTIALPANGCTV